MNAGQPTVAVIVPMYNSADTVDATIASVTQQSYPALDIIVVDDGCTDGSVAIIEDWARRDRRIRILQQPNGGVATARNTGAAATDAAYLAFVDADDLWAPDKIALQMEALAQQADGETLVYCWFVQIDAEGRAFSPGDHTGLDGDVFRLLCRSNFVGNGSSLLMPRAIFDHVGGFDPSLRAQDAQGCEDLLFLLKVAERYPFALVPRYLVGYRLTPNNMSSNTMRMLRSFEIVTAPYLQSHPEMAPEILAHSKDFLIWLIRRALIAGKFGEATRLLRRLAALDASMVSATLPTLLIETARARALPQWAKSLSRYARRRPRRPFYQELSW
ncbi:MAG: glycosyltransferase family 2 protein [Sphingomonas bacterium]|nr:glycosyltransferase family 2 protein [Sphingomonas bacterium]MDB5717640.1 glycosyltransferase family 2 protein [Sphingomonas bacterium]